MMSHTGKETARVQVVALETCLTQHKTIYRRYQELRQENKNAVVICDGKHFLGLFCRPVIRTLFAEPDGTLGTKANRYSRPGLGNHSTTDDEIDYAVEHGAINYGAHTTFPAVK